MTTAQEYLDAIAAQAEEAPPEEEETVESAVGATASDYIEAIHEVRKKPTEAPTASSQYIEAIRSAYAPTPPAGPPEPPPTWQPSDTAETERWVSTMHPEVAAAQQRKAAWEQSKESSLTEEQRRNLGVIGYSEGQWDTGPEYDERLTDPQWDDVEATLGTMQLQGVKTKPHPRYPGITQMYTEEKGEERNVNGFDVALTMAVMALPKRTMKPGEIESGGELEETDIGIMFNTVVPEPPGAVMRARMPEVMQLAHGLVGVDDQRIRDVAREIRTEKWRIANKVREMTGESGGGGIGGIGIPNLAIPLYELDPTHRQELGYLRASVRQLTNMELVLQSALKQGVANLDPGEGPSALLDALVVDQHPGQQDTNFRLNPKTGVPEFWTINYHDPLKDVPFTHHFGMIGLGGVARNLGSNLLDLYQGAPALGKAFLLTPNWALKNQARDAIITALKTGGNDPGKQVRLMHAILESRGVDPGKIPMPKEADDQEFEYRGVRYTPSSGLVEYAEGQLPGRRVPEPRSEYEMAEFTKQTRDILAGEVAGYHGLSIGSVAKELGRPVKTRAASNKNARHWIRVWAAMDDAERQEHMSPELYTAWNEAARALPAEVTKTLAQFEDSVTWDAPIRALSAAKEHIGGEIEDYGWGYFLENPVDFLMALSIIGQAIKAPLGVGSFLGFQPWKAAGMGPGKTLTGVAGERLGIALKGASRRPGGKQVTMAGALEETPILGAEAAEATRASLSPLQGVFEDYVMKPLRDTFGHRAPRRGVFEDIRKAETPAHAVMGPETAARRVSGTMEVVEGPVRGMPRGAGAPLGPMPGKPMRASYQRPYAPSARLAADEMGFTHEAARQYVRAQNMASYASAAEFATDLMVYSDPLLFGMAMFGMGGKAAIRGTEAAAGRGGLPAGGVAVGGRQIGTAAQWGSLDRELRRTLLKPRERQQAMKLQKRFGVTKAGDDLGTFYDLVIDLQGRRSADLKRMTDVLVLEKGYSMSKAQTEALHQLITAEHRDAELYIKIPVGHSGGPPPNLDLMNAREAAALDRAFDRARYSMDLRSIEEPAVETLLREEVLSEGTFIDEVVEKVANPIDPRGIAGEINTIKEALAEIDAKVALNEGALGGADLLLSGRTPKGARKSISQARRDAKAEIKELKNERAQWQKELDRLESDAAAESVVEQQGSLASFWDNPEFSEALSAAKPVEARKLRRQEAKKSRYEERRQKAIKSDDRNLGRVKEPLPEPRPDAADVISEVLEDVLPNPRVGETLGKALGDGWYAESTLSKIGEAWKEIRKNGSDHDIITFLQHQFRFNESQSQKLVDWAEKLRAKRDAQSIRAHSMRTRLKKAEKRVKDALDRAENTSRIYNDRKRELAEVVAGHPIEEQIKLAALGAEPGGALDAFIEGKVAKAEMLARKIGTDLVELMKAESLRPRLLRYTEDLMSSRKRTQVMVGDLEINRALKATRKAGFKALDSRRKALVMDRAHKRLTEKIANIARDPFRGLNEAKAKLPELKEYMPTKTEAYFDRLAEEVKELTPMFATGDDLFQRSKGSLMKEFTKWASDELFGLKDPKRLRGRLKANLDAVQRLYQDPTKGSPSVKKMAEMFRRGDPITSIPGSHLSLAKVLKHLRDLRRQSELAGETSEAAKGIWNKMTFNYSPAGAGDEMIIRAQDILDTFAKREAESHYLNWVDSKYNIHNITDVDVIYSPRLPGGGEYNILQLTPEASVATAMRKALMWAGAESVKLGNLSEFSYWTNVDTYMTAFYKQYEKLFQFGKGEKIALQEWTEAVRRGARDGFFSDRMKQPIIKYAKSLADQAERGLITSPKWYFGKGMWQIIHNNHHRRAIRALKNAMMEDGMPLGISAADVDIVGGRSIFQGKDVEALGYRHTGKKTFGDPKRKQLWFELEDHWVHPEAYEYINSATKIEGLSASKLWLSWNKWIGKWKAGVTVWWPPTHAHNYFANMWASTINGTNPLTSKSAREADFRKLIPQYWKRNGPDIEEALRANIFDRTFVDAETGTLLNQIYQDVAKGEKIFGDAKIRDPGYIALAIAEHANLVASGARTVLAKTKGSAKFVADFMPKLYRFEDEIFKLWRFNQIRILQKEFAVTGKVTKDMRRVLGNDDKYLFSVLDHPEVNSPAAMEAARLDLSKWYFDYTDIPGWVSVYRKLGKMFFTFQYKAVPQLTRWTKEHPLQALYWKNLFDTMNFLDEHMNGDMDYEIVREKQGLMGMASAYTREGGKISPKLEEVKYVTTDPETGERVVDTSYMPAAQNYAYWTAFANTLPRNEKMKHAVLDWVIDNPAVKFGLMLAGRPRHDPWSIKGKSVWKEKDDLDVMAQKLLREFNHIFLPALSPAFVPTKTRLEDGTVVDYVDWAKDHAPILYALNFLPGMTGGKAMEDFRLAMDNIPRYTGYDPGSRDRIMSQQQGIDKLIGASVWPIDVRQNTVGRNLKLIRAKVMDKYKGELFRLGGSAPGGRENPEYKRVLGEMRAEFERVAADYKEIMYDAMAKAQRRTRALFHEGIEGEKASLDAWRNNANKHPLVKSYKKWRKDRLPVIDMRRKKELDRESLLGTEPINIEPIK